MLPVLPEPLVTYQRAAEILNVKPWQIRRAAKRGAFAVYRPFNTRGLVRLSEVLAFVEASREGGAK